MIDLQFNSAFTGDHFKLSADGAMGTDVALAKGAGATVAGLSHDVLNFVSDFHRGLTDRTMPTASRTSPKACASRSEAAFDVPSGCADH